MGVYSVNVDTIATGSSANAYTSLLGLKLANTDGHRARLRRIAIGGASGAAQDVNVALRLQRTNIAGDGTSTAVNVNTIAKMDPLQIASVIAAIGETYTVEPTTFDGFMIALGSINSRGTLVIEWPDGKGPLWGKGQCMVLQGAPGAATATTLAVGVEWEEGI